jgi:hypothetical protein
MAMEIELQTNKAAESIMEHRFREIMISSPVLEIVSVCNRTYMTLGPMLTKSSPNSGNGSFSARTIGSRMPRQIAACLKVAGRNLDCSEKSTRMPFREVERSYPQITQITQMLF